MCFHPKCVGMIDHSAYPKWSCPTCTAYFISQHHGDATAKPAQNVLTSVDPSYKGNLARFINHACDPNIKARYAKRNESRELVFCTTRQVSSGDWLTVNYNPNATSGNPNCLCGAPNCKGWYPL